jgi:hypothetical protein
MSAIIYFNSTILTHLLTHFEQLGDEERLKITKQVSPVAWHNINLNGTYRFDLEKNAIDIAVILRPITESSVDI